MINYLESEDDTESADSSLSGSRSDLALDLALALELDLDLALLAALLLGTGLRLRDDAFLGGLGESPPREMELLEPFAILQEGD